MGRHLKTDHLYMNI